MVIDWESNKRDQWIKQAIHNPHQETTKLLSEQRWGSYQLSRINDKLFTATKSSSEWKLVRPFQWRQQYHCCQKVNNKLNKVVICGFTLNFECTTFELCVSTDELI